VKKWGGIRWKKEKGTHPVSEKRGGKNGENVKNVFLEGGLGW